VESKQPPTAAAGRADAAARTRICLKAPVIIGSELSLFEREDMDRLFVRAVHDRVRR
jgi:hypothetical protein